MTRRLIRVLGTVLLMLPFMVATAYAKDVPVSMKWAGTVTDIAIDTNGDGLFADLIDADVKGSFGASSMGVFTEFYFAGFCDDEQKVFNLNILYSKPVTTFSNGDQLWGNITAGSMCLNTETGEFSGDAEGNYTGGTGRFADATGWFVVDFEGTNLTLPEGLPGFGAIRGTTNGAVELK
jgi:hypothetical protein